MMDIPLPSDNASKEKGKHGSQLLPDEPKRTTELGKPLKNHTERTNSRFRNSSKREESSSYQNWNRYGSKHDRNKNNHGKNSDYEDEKMHNSSYAIRGANYAANNEFQEASSNFNSNTSNDYVYEGFKTNIPVYHDPITVQQNSSEFNQCLNTMNSVNMPGFGYGGINPVNQCYDSTGISNATCSSSINNIPPNYNYGSSNFNAYNNASSYTQLNPNVPSAMNSYSYNDVNAINLTNMCSTQPPESYLNYNVAVQGVHSSDNSSNYSSFPSEGTAATSASLALPMPPLPPVLPKMFNKLANESVSEVPLPKLPPIMAIKPDNAPPPLSSVLTEIPKKESSLDCKPSSPEVPCANQDSKLSNLQNPDFKDSKSNISDIMQNNPPVDICEVAGELLNKEVVDINNKLCELQDCNQDINGSNRELGSSTLEENKIEENDMENKESENVIAKEACDAKKVILAFSSIVKTVNIEKSFLDPSESDSPRKKSCNFPCLGKEMAKKRLRAFSAAKLHVKEKTTKSSRINPLQDDQDENESNSQTNPSNENKKETSYKKKKITEIPSIAQIKEKEERVKRILNQNTEIIKSFNNDLVSSCHMYNLQGINYFDISNLEKFEEKTNAVQKFLELKRDEEAKNECREKRRSRSVSRDHDRRRDKKYHRSGSREKRHVESNKVKKFKGTSKKEVELPKSWNDIKELRWKMEDLCNFLQKHKNDHNRSRSPSPGFEPESGTHKRKDKRKFQYDPFPFFPKNFKDLHALKREERLPLSKDYNSYRQDNFKKSYRGCNVQYTSVKPTICYNIDSDRYDYHYLSQKALKYKNSSDVMHIIDGFPSKTFKRQEHGMGVKSTKTRMWYPEDWMKAKRERTDEKEMKCITSEQNAFPQNSESYGHSSKMASSTLKIEDQSMIATESLSDAKLYNEKVKYRRNILEAKKPEHHYDEKIDSDIDMHARFFTEENDEDEEETVDNDENSEFGVDGKQHLNEFKDSYVDVTDSADDKLCDEQISKSLLLDEEYEAFLCTFDSKTLPKIENKSSCLLESSFKEELTLKPLSNELVKKLKTKAHSDIPAYKVYEEVKAILKDSDSNEEGYERLKKLKKKLKQRMDKEKKVKKKAKKALKEIKKGKKTKKVLLEEIEPFKKMEDSLDDIIPEQNMLDYEVIEYENYSDESEHRNIESQSEIIEKGKGENSELSGSSDNCQFSPSSNLEGNNTKPLYQDDEVSNSDQENDRYSPSNLSQYSEEEIDVDSNNIAMELSSPSAPSSSPQLESTGSPSSHPYSPSNMFEDDEYDPSPYSPSSPQSSGSCSPPQNDKFSNNQSETIVNSIPVPPSNLNKFPDNLAQQDGSTDLSDKNIASGEIKESSVIGVAVKGFQPVTFKLNLTRQTSAKLLQKPSLAGFDFDEEEGTENTKSPLPIVDLKDLPLLAFETNEGELLLPQNKDNSEKHLVDSVKYIEKENFNNDIVKTKKSEPEKKRRKSPSPRKSSRHHSRSRSRSPKECRRKSYEKTISKSLCRKEKSYRDNSPLSSSSYRRKDRSRTPESYKHLGNKISSASEKQRHVRSPSTEKMRDVYEKDLCYNKKSKSRTPSPVPKWKKVRSPPPKKFRQKSSYDLEEEPYSEHPYRKEMLTEDHSALSGRNHSRSSERSPNAGIKHKEDKNFCPPYDGDIMPISSISNFDFKRANNEFGEHPSDHTNTLLFPSISPHRLSLDENLKQEVSPEYEEYNHGSEYGNCNYWSYNTNQVPQQVAGSSQVVRIGNVLQVLPQDSSPEDVFPTPVASPGTVQSTSKDLQEIGQSSSSMPRKMVQTGNIIEVVPAGISEQDILVSNSSHKETAVFNSGLVPHIPLPDKPSTLKSILEDLSATKISAEKPPMDKNIYENTSSLKILPEKLSPLINFHDNMQLQMETLPENISPLKSPDNLSPMQIPAMTVGTSSSLPLPASSPFSNSSSFVASPAPKKDHNIDSAASTYVATLSNQSSPALINAHCYGKSFGTQENTGISTQDPMNSGTMELIAAESPLITSIESQQHAIFSAAVSAARGETAGDHALAQLLSVLQQQRMAPALVDSLSAQHPIDQSMMNVDLTAFKQQKRERKERKQKEKEQRLARREKRRLEREKQELKSKSILSDDEDDIVMKEAITEVPDLGSPVPEYEIYNDDEDEEEQELEKKERPALVILPPPEKGILVSPSYRILNITKGKSVSFADGVIPGDGTDISGGEEIHSPPPPNAEPEKKKGKKLTKKKRVKVKRIKQFKFGNSRMDSPPPPPTAFPPNGNVIKLYQGCSYASCTAPSTYVVYTQRPMEVNGNDSFLGKV